MTNIIRDQDWIDYELDRLLREADERERLAEIERLARAERINAILDRSVWRERKPDGGSVVALIAAGFVSGALLAVLLAPAGTWAALGY